MIESDLQQIGPFTIVRELGRGGMGVVYESRDDVLGRPVAVKLIPPSVYGQDPEWKSRQEQLLKEARSAALLAHPNIVTIYKAGLLDDAAFIEMELVKGVTLENLLDSKELEQLESIRVLKEIATALDFAHQRGVIHRDVKPANVMICEGGTAKLMDFGIARLASELLAYTGELTGSPQFMAPEQVRGDVVTERADQYSLAAIAYRLLTGGHTVSADTIAQLTYRVLFEHPVPANVMNPNLSVRVHEVLKRALSKKPELRFSSCTHLILALEEAITHQDTVLDQPERPAITDTREIPTQAAKVQEPLPVEQPHSFWGRHPFLSGVLFMLLVDGAFLILLYRILVMKPEP